MSIASSSLCTNPLKFRSEYEIVTLFLIGYIKKYRLKEMQTIILTYLG